MTFRRKKRMITIISVIMALLLAGGAVGMYFVAARIYDESFARRCTTPQKDFFRVSDFPGLSRQRHTFVSDKGQTLVGYLYSMPEAEQKAVLVFAHGFGAGGQTGYMEIFDYMTRRGYYVFAYDATANDESEGEAVGGLPQGIIDLDHAIDYVCTLDETTRLPVILMGYSWGAISVSNVLNYHPEVKAIAAFAGCNRSLDLISDRACEKAGDIGRIMIPFAALHEFFLFGKYAFSSAMKGFAASDCKVMIIHGAQDAVVPIRYGYETYFEKYKDDERFFFRKFPDRGHDIMKNSAGQLDLPLMEETAAFFDSSLTH